MATKRRKTMMAQNSKPREVMLSSLPDAILIDIISLLPFKSAIITDTLSKRWRNLWTQVTSIYIDNPKTLNYEFITALDESMHKLTSPFIHTFILDFGGMAAALLCQIPIDSLIRRICQRNVRHLSVSWPNYSGYYTYKAQTPCYILETQSLVSIELSSVLIDDGGLINLPNLKKLSASFTPSRCEWLKKLFETSPLLEELSLMARVSFVESTICVNCSSPNLRRLCINLGFNKPSKFVINAPKLEYLDARAVKSTIFHFGDKLIWLREAKLEFLDDDDDDADHDRRRWNSKFYKAMSNVRILTLNYNALNTFTTFPNLTRLTLTMDFPCNFKTLLLFLALCPLLDVLTLKFGYSPVHGESWNLPKQASLLALGRVKRIEIDTCYDLELKKYFSDTVVHLLGSASVLEHFCFSVAGGMYLGKGSEMVRKGCEKREYQLCDVLYKCPRASIDCEVLFLGRFLLMSRKAGPNVLRSDGVTIAIK